jgi:hypothetical protein
MLPPPTITNFRVTRCVQQMSNGKVYNNFTMGWNASPTQKIGSYQIGSYHTNNATSAAVIATVSFSQTSATVGGYLSGTVTVNRYFWVRYVDVVSKPIRVTAWVPLNPNPLATNYCGA